ncbi:MAG: hypothetical protein JWM27_2518 [Gemmatimonadetes bacterium]|nr:hypothetical protein [Gemmatimonadota bacterium]
MYALAAAALAAGAGTAGAQQTDGFLRPPTSLSMGVFDGASVELGHRLSPATDLGLAVSGRGGRRSDRYTGVAGASGSTQREWDVTIEPSVKHYSGTGGPLLPYTYASLLLSHARSVFHQEGEPSSHFRGTGVGASVGLGVDWFLAPRVSVGGRAVLAGGFQRTSTAPDTGPTLRSSQWYAGTGRSGVQVTFHF